MNRSRRAPGGHIDFTQRSPAHLLPQQTHLPVTTSKSCIRRSIGTCPMPSAHSHTAVSSLQRWTVAFRADARRSRSGAVFGHLGGIERSQRNTGHPCSDLTVNHDLRLMSGSVPTRIFLQNGFDSTPYARLLCTRSTDLALSTPD